MPRWCPTLKPPFPRTTKTRIMLGSEQGGGRSAGPACVSSTRRAAANYLRAGRPRRSLTARARRRSPAESVTVDAARATFRRPPRTTSGRRRRLRRRSARPRPRPPSPASAQAATVVVVARPLRWLWAAARRRPRARGGGECWALAALLSARRGARRGPSASLRRYCCCYFVNKRALSGFCPGSPRLSSFLVCYRPL